LESKGSERSNSKLDDIYLSSNKTNSRKSVNIKKSKKIKNEGSDNDIDGKSFKPIKFNDFVEARKNATTNNQKMKLDLNYLLTIQNQIKNPNDTSLSAKKTSSGKTNLTSDFHSNRKEKQSSYINQYLSNQANNEIKKLKEDKVLLVSEINNLKEVSKNKENDIKVLKENIEKNKKKILMK